MEVLERIKRFRMQKNFSQAQMAEILGMAQNNYGKLERGLTELTLSRLYEISVILGVSVSTLLGEGDSVKRIEDLELTIKDLKEKLDELHAENTDLKLTYRLALRLFKRKVEEKNEEFLPDTKIEFSYRELLEERMLEFDARWDKIMAGDKSPFEEYTFFKDWISK